MTRREKVICFGLPAAALALVCLYEASCETTGDGRIPITVTVRSQRSIQLRRVTFDNFGQKDAADECLQYPQNNEVIFREGYVDGPQLFQFDVPITERTSPFGILKNRFYWRPFAVFRIETTDGEVHYVGTEVPDVRTTKAITIDIPK